MPHPNNKILKIIVFLIVIIAIIHITAYYFHLYLELWWIDMMMHFLGGAWVAAFILWAIFFSGFFNLKSSVGTVENKNTLLEFLLIAFVTVLFIGVVWELFEFKAGLSFFSPITLSVKGYWQDTISDVILDLGGGLVMSMYLYKLKNQSAKIKMTM